MIKRIMSVIGARLGQLLVMLVMIILFSFSLKLSQISSIPFKMSQEGVARCGGQIFLMDPIYFLKRHKKFYPKQVFITANI